MTQVLSCFAYTHIHYPTHWLAPFVDCTSPSWLPTWRGEWENTQNRRKLKLYYHTCTWMYAYFNVGTIDGYGIRVLCMYVCTWHTSTSYIHTWSFTWSFTTYEGTYIHVVYVHKFKCTITCHLHDDNYHYAYIHKFIHKILILLTLVDPAMQCFHSLHL